MIGLDELVQRLNIKLPGGESWIRLVGEVAGMHYQQVWRYASGATSNIQSDTMERLESALDELEAEYDV